jgi:IS1 transposase
VNPLVVTGDEGVASAVVVCKVREAELDEMWSFVGRKKQPRWLWGALDHQTGRMMAYVFGRREDQALLALKALLTPWALVASTLMAGGPITGTWIPTDMWSASGGHNS